MYRKVLLLYLICFNIWRIFNENPWSNLVIKNCFVSRHHQSHHELKFPGWKIRIGVEWLVSVLANVNSVLDSEQ